LYAHSLALPHRLCFVLARCSQRCDGQSQKYCLMFEINLLWNSYGLSQTIETCSTQHLYQKNSFAVQSVVHSGNVMAFLPGRPLKLECIRGAQDIRRMVPSHILSHEFISVTVASGTCPFMSQHSQLSGVIFGQFTSRPINGQAPSIAVTSGKHYPTRLDSNIDYCK
jgi:hypothetical protein